MLIDKVNDHEMEENTFFGTLSNSCDLHRLLENNNNNNNTEILRKQRGGRSSISLRKLQVETAAAEFYYLHETCCP